MSAKKRVTFTLDEDTSQKLLSAACHLRFSREELIRRLAHAAWCAVVASTSFVQSSADVETMRRDLDETCKRMTLFTLARDWPPKPEPKPLHIVRGGAS